jgi:hypothetical protein
VPDSALIVIDMLNAYDHEDADRLVESARGAVPRIAELLERAVGRRQTQWEYYTALLKAQRAETAAIASVATKLRLTPQSLRNDRGNIRIAAAPAGPPPWEWRPDGEGGVS